MVRMGEEAIVPKVWDDVVTVMEEKLKEIEFSPDDIQYDWRRPADAKRLERELFEKYGMFKDLILDPRFQYWKQFAEENVDFDLFLGDPLLPMATVVIVLFMLHKRVSNNVVALGAALLFNVNPFYVCLTLAGLWLLNKTKKPKQYRAVKHSAVPADVATYAPVPFSPASAADLAAGTYDHVLVGNDLATLYTAALLSRTGHKCVVLQPRGAPPARARPADAPYAVPLRNTVVSKVERYQSLLDTVQLGGPAAARMPAGERVAFAPVGTAADCFAHTVLRINASSSSGSSSSSSSGSKSKGGAGGSTWLLRAGETSLSTDLSWRLHTDKAAITVFFKSVASAQAAVTAYLISKAGAAPVAPAPAAAPAAAAPAADASGAFGPIGGAIAAASGAAAAAAASPAAAAAAAGADGTVALDSQVAKAEGMTQFMNLSTASMEVLMSRVPDISDDEFSALAAAAAVGAEECLSASDISSLSLAATLSHADQAVFYPQGGYDAIEKALVRAVRAAGGEVHTDVPIRGILCEADEAEGKVRAIGVRLGGAALSRAGSRDSVAAVACDDGEDDDADPSLSTVRCGHSVVSGVGALCTYTRLLPPEAVSDAARKALALLVEARPRVAVVFWLKGGLAELGLASTDYVEIPAQSAGTSGSAALGHGGLAALQAHRENFAAGYVRVWSPSAKDPLWGQTHGADEHAVVVELEAGESVATLKPFKFAADPAGGSAGTGAAGGRGAAAAAAGIGPRVYEDADASRAAAEAAAAAAGGCAVGQSAALSKSLVDKAQARALQKLLQVYPALAVEGRIVATHVVPPTLGGHAVANAPTKYAATGLTARTDVRDLFLTGRDLATTGLAADFQSGWLTANAVLGYTTAELLAGRNVAMDLGR